jgi:uncharacterized membrane protein YfcA
MAGLEILLGFFIALMIGLTGVGGGTLTVPILVLFMGVSPAVAVGTALVFSALVKVPACIVYVRARQVSLPILRYLALGGVPGVILGSLLLGRLEGAGLKSLVLAVVGLTIAATATLNLLRLRTGHESGVPRHDRRQRLPWVAFPIGCEVGFSSAGAGALGTLALLSLTTLPAASVVGTDLLFGLTLSSIGGGLHVGMGAWDRGLLVQMILGGIPGGLLGARLATVLPPRPLRAVLLVWLVYLGGELLYRGVGSLL